MNDLTADEGWHYLDLSSIVGAHETLVMLYVNAGDASGGLVSAGMYYSGELALDSGVYTKIPFNYVLDGFTDGLEDLSNYRIDIPNTGFYIATLNAAFLVYEDNKELRMSLSWVHGMNAEWAITYNQPQHNSPGSSMLFSSSVSRIFYADAGSYFEGRVLGYSAANKPKLKGYLAGDSVQLTVHQISSAWSVSGSIYFRAYGHTNAAACCMLGLNQQICVKTDANGVIEYKITGSPSTLNLKVLGWRPVYVIGG